MGRNVRNPFASLGYVEPAPDAPVKPYPDDGDYPAVSMRVARANAAFKLGDVIYTEIFDRHGDKVFVKALVHIAFPRARHDGDYQMTYRVRLLTKAGQWAKNWVETHPGHIQRGYELAAKAAAEAA